MTFDRQRSGERVFDINTDGVAHYGLYPDWIEDLRKIAGNEIVEDMARGRRGLSADVGARRSGSAPRPAARRAGRSRAAAWAPSGSGTTPTRSCAAQASPRSAGRARVALLRARRRQRQGQGRRRADERGQASRLVASTARDHRSLRIGPGSRASLLRGKATPFGPGVRVRRLGRSRTRIVYGVRRGRVRYVAVAAPSAVSSRKRLAQYVRRAGVR